MIFFIGKVDTQNTQKCNTLFWQALKKSSQQKLNNKTTHVILSNIPSSLNPSNGKALFSSNGTAAFD